MLAENLIGLGFLYSVSYIIPILTHEKLFAVRKKWPKCHFQPTFSWVGLALGWGIRRFHSNVYMFPNPTELGISPTPYCVRVVDNPTLRRAGNLFLRHALNILIQLNNYLIITPTRL